MRLRPASVFRAISAAAIVLLVSIRACIAADSGTNSAVDLSRYFATAAAEHSDRTQLFTAVAAFGASTVRARDAAELERYLQEADRLYAALARHESYLHLKGSIDTGDQESRSADDEVQAQLGTLRTIVENTLQHIAPNEFDAMVAERPALARYAFLFEAARREASHTLAADQQLIIERLSLPSLSALFDLYMQTIRSTPFGTVAAAGGDLDLWSNRRVLAVNPDRSIRQRAAEGLLQGFDSRAGLYAGLLLEIVRAHDRVAQLQHFADAPSAVYFERYQTTESVKALLASVERNAEVNKSWQRLSASHFGATTGVADVHSWDVAAPLQGFTIPQFSVEQAEAVAMAALAALGPEYVGQLRALLDPSNGRADIAGGTATRYGGGFSKTAPGVESALYVGNFQGSLNDARVVVHEGGHAVHGQLMNENAVTPWYAHGPNWMGESFAILNELLLYDHLYRSGSDPQTRAYYLTRLIDDMAFQIFTSATEGSLEQAIYEGAASGRIRNAADLDALTATTLDRYEIWIEREPERRHQWMTKQLMFEDPLYLVNYLQAGLLATKLYAMAKEHPADFRRRYLPLLKRGFHAPPETLLRDFFGRNVSQEELVDDSMAVLKTKIAELAAIYRKSERR